VSERAALYTVTVRPKRGKSLPLGDLDGRGTSLLSILAGLLGGFSESSADGTRVVMAEVSAEDGDDLLAIVRHGARGVAADIVDASGGVRFRQTPADLQLVRCGCLFRLPASATVGKLAVHVSNGRGVKGLFEQGLTARFTSLFPGLALAIERLAEPGAVRDAVARDRVESLRLLLLEPPGSRSVADTDKWLPAGEPAKVELVVVGRAAGARIERGLLERYLGGDSSALADIVEFGGITFDEARIGVRLDDGGRRIYDLAHPDAGRPADRELAGIVVDDAGEPTEASLLEALRSALTAGG
jgi:hypothetical protein